MLVNVLIKELPKEVLISKLQEVVGERIEIPIEQLSASAIRLWLVEQLGGSCVRCQAVVNLEVHHKLGGGTILRGLFGERGELIRIATEWNNGKYCLVCYRCHPALEPQTFRRLAAKNQHIHSNLKTRMRRERARLFDGSPGCAAREQESYFKYEKLQRMAREKYDCILAVKRLYNCS